MKIKRLIVFVVIACMVCATPVSANMKTNWITSSGKFYMGQMIGKRVFKEELSMSSLSKKQKKEALRLYNKDPRKLYKKYRKVIRTYRVFKTKLKKNTLTVWGRFSRVTNGIKRKYKFGKYKFKLSKNAILTYWSTVMTSTHRGKKLRKELKNPYGIGYDFYVTRGTITKIETMS